MYVSPRGARAFRKSAKFGSCVIYLWTRARAVSSLCENTSAPLFMVGMMYTYTYLCTVVMLVWSVAGFFNLTDSVCVCVYGRIWGIASGDAFS